MLLLKSFTSERSVDSASLSREDSYLRPQGPLYFHCASGFATQILAYMLDSLVRVSRRVNENHFVSIANAATGTSTAVFTFRTAQTLVSHALGQTDHRVPYAEACRLSFLSPNQCRTQRCITAVQTPYLPRFLPRF